jgi:hypothetical protein
MEKKQPEVKSNKISTQHILTYGTEVMYIYATLC